MPDENKLEAMREQRVRCAKVCALCRHASFRPTSFWGECGVGSYTHKKHTGGALPLPVHMTMTCPAFDRGHGSRHASASLGEYGDLVGGLEAFDLVDYVAWLEMVVDDWDPEDRDERHEQLKAQFESGEW